MQCNVGPYRSRLAVLLSVALVLVACQSATNQPATGGTGNTGSSPQFATPAGGNTSAAAAAAPTSMTGTNVSGKASSGPPVGAAGQSGGGGQAPATGGAAGMPSSGAGDTAQAPSSGDAGAPAASDAGTTTMHPDLGKGDGSDVITIGDSWMSIITNGGGIEGGLDRAGTMYRHYSVAGTTLINGDIPQQYERAKAANPKIQTVIMTGGGNDVMFSNGCATADSCMMAVQAIVDALDKLWTEMATDGVKDVIFIEYSKNAGTAPSGTRPASAPIPPICLTGKITCHSVTTDDEVGPNDTIDGIHPTLAACDLIAKKVLDMMAMQGVRR
ncbi:MAG: SGNH/GDSL hydrolase family protein [Polyangiales bacterium]